MCLVVSVLSIPSSFAALGDRSAAIDADRAQLHATRRISYRGVYDVHELTQASGTVVREYADPAGTVFAIAWRGPIKPDLRQLLGQYFTRFVEAGKNAHGDHRHLTVRATDLVIESHGRMRAFFGRAYLPTLVPANVSLDDIQ